MIVAVRYTIHVTTSRAGLKLVSGHATAVDAHVMFRFVTGGGEATLILENGRRWECVVQNGMGILTNRSENPPFSVV